MNGDSGDYGVRQGNSLVKSVTQVSPFIAKKLYNGDKL